MEVSICSTKAELGKKAAQKGADLIRHAIRSKGSANIILATGASQFEMLKALASEKKILWNRVVVFHLDEYVGMSVTHPASFRLYLWQRFLRKLPLPVGAFHQIDAEKNPGAECECLSRLIRRHPIDVAFIGIGENGHIAFNDPPADFKTTKPYIVVRLDEACRKQQFGEGWFKSLKEVPKEAVSMSVRQIMKSKTIICSVPDERKSRAVQACLQGPVTPQAPGSILQRHRHATVYLDRQSASRLNRARNESFLGA
jgi:glucosamine-6-phosphate deaminase